MHGRVSSDRAWVALLASLRFLGVVQGELPAICFCNVMRAALEVVVITSAHLSKPPEAEFDPAGVSIGKRAQGPRVAPAVHIWYAHSWE